jgi:hypothetical protein
MSEKKLSPKKNATLHSIRTGDVIAQIFLRKSNSGYAYMDFTLERCFSTSTGKENRGASFFAKNEHEIVQAAHEAAAWIRDRLQADAQAALQSDTQ